MIYKKIRQQYGLSRVGMSRVLGFGINQWRMYEDGKAEPKHSHALIISMIQDPRSFRKLLIRHETALKIDLGEKKFIKTLETIDELLLEFKKKQDLYYNKWMESLYR